MPTLNIIIITFSSTLVWLLYSPVGPALCIPDRELFIYRCIKTCISCVPSSSKSIFLHCWTVLNHC